MSEDPIRNELDEIKKEIKRLQQRVDLLEDENEQLKRKNTYLGMLVTSNISDESIKSVDRMWGEPYDLYDYTKVTREGTYAEVLCQLLTESTNDSIDMFVLTQLPFILNEPRVNGRITVDTMQQILQIFRTLRNEDVHSQDFMIALECLFYIIVSNIQLIGFFIDDFLMKEKINTLQELIIAEGIQFIAVQCNNEVIMKKVLDYCLDENNFILNDCLNDNIQSEYKSFFFTGIKLCLKSSESIAEMYKQRVMKLPKNIEELKEFL